jgi:ABC-2 type transport system ATP-binding protein
VRHGAGESVLDVHKEDVNRVVGQALARLPVSDLTVENPPLEEVMSELFARGKAAAARAESRSPGALEAAEGSTR